MHIGLIGGGNLARNLAGLFHGASHHVSLGVRDPAAQKPSPSYTVTSMAEAAAASIVILCVPYSACATLLPTLEQSLSGKTVVDATNPVNADWTPLQLGENNSAAEEIARALPRSHVVKAFNTVFADVMSPERLRRGDRQATMFAAADDASAKQTVLTLANGAGFDGRDAGPLRNARYLEAMAHLNIYLAVALGGGTNAAFIYDQAS
jgi:hypothetical protein